MEIGRSDYEERREHRIERLRERAASENERAQATFTKVERISSMIPLGQPILIGHHSERHARRDAEKIRTGMRAAIDAQQNAKHLEARAQAAEDNNAISSDDPNALERLRAKLAGIEASRAKAVAINKALRMAKGDVAKTVAALKTHGCTEAQTLSLLTPDFCGRIGIPDYKLTNWGSEARRIKQRISQLEARSEREPKPDEQIGEVTITESDNRVKLLFPGKPSEAIRSQLKSNGFRWSPTAGAWQRMPSDWAWHVARQIATAATKETP